mmetsp:Transcript_14285/g.24439  ORF Transcript_14285/g.24439 Transcript_14285/m.24439 type:complete len:239 (-) Transcript_14285:1043-1759(-)
MLGEERRGVEHLTVDHHPTVVFAVVFGDFSHGDVGALLWSAIGRTVVIGSSFGSGLIVGWSSGSGIACRRRRCAAKVDVNGDATVRVDLHRCTIANSTRHTSSIQRACGELGGSIGTGHATKHNTIEQRRATKTIHTMNSTHHFSSGKQAWNFIATRVQHRRASVDSQTAHGVVHHRRDLSDVKVLLHRHWRRGEEQFAVRIFFARCYFVVVIQCFLQHIAVDTSEFSQCLTIIHQLH